MKISFVLLVAVLGLVSANPGTNQQDGRLISRQRLSSQTSLRQPASPLGQNRPLYPMSPQSQAPGRLSASRYQNSRNPLPPLTIQRPSGSPSLSPLYNKGSAHQSPLGSPFSLNSRGSTASPGSKSRPIPTFPPINTTPVTPPCDCNCYKHGSRPLCAMDPVTKDQDTFLNECQLDCFNCTMKKRYKIIKHAPCDE